MTKWARGQATGYKMQPLDLSHGPLESRPSSQPLGKSSLPPPEPPRPAGRRCPAAQREAAGERRRRPASGPRRGSGRTVSRPGSHASSAPARTSRGSRLARPRGSRPLRPRPLARAARRRPEEQHESSALRAGAPAALALPERGVWRAPAADLWREGDGGRQRPLFGAAQRAEERPRTLAGRSEEVPAPAATPLPQGPHAFLKQD